MIAKETIAAGLFAAALALTPGTASAKTNLFIGVGPGWGHNCWDFPGGDCGYQRHHRSRTELYLDDGYDYSDREGISCSEAKDMLREDGFHRVRTISCGEWSYRFKAIKRDRVYYLKVSARSGNVTVLSRD